MSPNNIVGATAKRAYLERLRPHVWPLLFLLAIAWGWAAFSWNTGIEHIKQSDTTMTYFSVVMKYKHERDNMPDLKKEWQWWPLLKQVVADQGSKYATVGMKSLYHESFERYLATVYRVTGDITLGYRLLVFPLNLLFLLGAYALFFHLTEKPVFSAALAFFASFPIAIPIAGEFFGMGPVTIYSRRNLFTAFVPLAIYLFYLWIQRPRLLIAVFALVGLIANLHASGILLAGILVFGYFLFHTQKSGSWRYAAFYGLIVLVFGFMAVGRLWDQVGSLLNSLVQQIIPSAHAAISGFMQKEGILEGEEFLFYPLRIYSHLPPMVQHAMTLFVVLLSCCAIFLRHRLKGHTKGALLFFAGSAGLAFLGFSEFKYFLLLGGAAFALTWKQSPDLNFELTHYLILATFFVSFIGMLLFQTGFYAIDGFPLISNQLRGARFLGLIVFVWLAVLITRINWDNLKLWNKWFFILVSAITLLMTARQDFRSHIRYETDPDSVALLDVAKWSKKHTPQDATFLVVSTRFGIVAERNIFLHDRESCTTAGQALFSRMQGNFAELKQLARENQISYIVVRKNLGESAAAEMFSKHDNQRYVLAKDLGELPVGTAPVYDNQRFALFKVY